MPKTEVHSEKVLIPMEREGRVVKIFSGGGYFTYGYLKKVMKENFPELESKDDDLALVISPRGEFRLLEIRTVASMPNYKILY